MAFGHSHNTSGIHSAGGYLSGQSAANPVSLGLIRLESSSAGVLADIARKGEQGLKKILRNISTHSSPQPLFTPVRDAEASPLQTQPIYLYPLTHQIKFKAQTVRNGILALQTPQLLQNAAPLPKATVCLSLKPLS